MMSHTEARRVVLGALRLLYPGAGDAPPLFAQAVQSIGLFEGSYGEPGKPASWSGSNNWGAVHSSDKPPCVPGRSFLFEDANNTGDSNKTPQCFKIYPTPEAGAADMARNLLRTEAERVAFASGDADRMALAMYDAGYFLGFNRDPDLAVRRQKNAAAYAAGIARAAERIAAGTGEPLLVTRKGGETPPQVPVPPKPGTSGSGPIVPPGPTPPPPPAEGSASGAGVAVVALALVGVVALAARKGGR